MLFARTGQGDPTAARISPRPAEASQVPTTGLGIFPACLVATLAAAAWISCALVAASPAQAAEKGGGGGGWDSLISTLTGLVPACGGIGMMIGTLVWALGGPNSDMRGLGVTILGTSFAGLLVGLLAPDIYAFFAQWI